MPRPRTNPPKVKTLEKGLQLLLSLSRVSGEMTLGEITTTVRGHPSTTYRLLAALEKYGFVRRDPHTGRFNLGLRLAELGHLALERIELRMIARPLLQRLMEETAETIHLMVLDGDTGLYIDRVESPQRVRVASSLGERQSLHCSAVGKAILAFIDEERCNQIIAGRLPRFTANTITSAAALRRHLAEVKRRGVAFDDCEVEEGVRCVGAPILDHTGQAVASISISGPAYRVDLQDLRAWAPLVRQGGLEISAALGFRSAGVTLQATGSR
jgi:DNA-binding IclR family transcriptional regulator